MNIPSVKTWIVTTIEGDKFEVLAPTRLLAVLNFRHDYGYGHIIEKEGLTFRKTLIAYPTLELTINKKQKQ